MRDVFRILGLFFVLYCLWYSTYWFGVEPRFESRINPSEPSTITWRPSRKGIYKIALVVEKSLQNVELEAAEIDKERHGVPWNGSFSITSPRGAILLTNRLFLRRGGESSDHRYYSLARYVMRVPETLKVEFLPGEACPLGKWVSLWIYHSPAGRLWSVTDQWMLLLCLFAIPIGLFLSFDLPLRIRSLIKQKCSCPCAKSG